MVVVLPAVVTVGVAYVCDPGLRLCGVASAKG